MIKERKNMALGQGLEELFGDIVPATTGGLDQKDALKGKVDTLVEKISMDSIRPNASQPRKTFDPKGLEELAQSIEEHGVIQPILVRPVEGGYEIVAGERRYRAARMAKKKNIPCIVNEISEEENMLFAIIENMQREDLNPIEEAEGIQTMLDSYGMTQNQVAKSIGKSRSQISNMTRLLNLPEKIREHIITGQLSAGHGRALVAMDDKEKQLETAEEIIKEQLSVRDLEALLNGKKQTKRKKPRKLKKHGDVVALEDALKVKFGTKVNIHHRGGKGKIEIEFYNSEERDRIIEILKK